MIKIIEIQESDIPNFLEIGIENAPCVLFAYHKGDYALICEDKEYNIDDLKRNNISSTNINGKGGTIICTNGDVDFAFVGSEDYCWERLGELSKFISHLLTDGKLLNNDFIYGNNKYGSYTTIKKGDMFCIASHISNNINKKLIDEICFKNCYKIPEKLPEPITKEQIYQIFKGV